MLWGRAVLGWECSAGKVVPDTWWARQGQLVVVVVSGWDGVVRCRWHLGGCLSQVATPGHRNRPTYALPSYSGRRISVCLVGLSSTGVLVTVSCIPCTSCFEVVEEKTQL